MKTKNLGSGCPTKFKHTGLFSPFRIQSLHHLLLTTIRARGQFQASQTQDPHCGRITVLLPCACCGSTHSDLCSPGASSALPTKMTKLSPNTANAPRGQSHSGENLSTQTGSCNFTYLTLVHVQEEGEKGRCFRAQGSYQKSFPACASPPRM